MTSITVEVDDEVLRTLAARAAARGTTTEKLAGEYLASVAKAPPPIEPNLEEARRKIRELVKTSAIDFGPVTWTRDDLHER